jgi:hypothetical protein
LGDILINKKYFLVKLKTINDLLSLIISDSNVRMRFYLDKLNNYKEDIPILKESIKKEFKILFSKNLS